MKDYTREEKCLLWMQNVIGLSWRCETALLEKHKTAEGVFDSFGPSMERLVGARAYKQLAALRAKGLEATVQAMQDAGAEAVFPDGDEYPDMLKGIHDRPFALFMRGKGEKDERSVAIVGSRRDTRYGRTQAFSIAKELARHGVTVVSGLARGIDTAAHEGALAAGGRTVAVLGNGIDSVYPDENAKLAQRIVDAGGAIFSEFALGTGPLAHHFPSRNRIITGISAALLLVEGGERSGTMITANHATDQGRQVYALPGMVDAPGSVAPLTLLREGAGICTSPHDILLDMGWISLDEAWREMTAAKRPKVPDVSLTASQKVIVKALTPEPQRFEDLLTTTGMDTGSLASDLSMLEIDGVVEPRPGRVYALK